MATKAIETKITADTRGFRAGIDQARASSRSLAREVQAMQATMQGAFGLMTKAVGALGLAFGGAQIVNELKAIAAHVDGVGKTAGSIGITTEALSKLQYAAKLNGSSTDAMSSALIKLQKAMAETAAGTGEGKAAFDALGVSVKGADGEMRAADTVFRDIAVKFSGMRDGANKTALAMRLFGESGSEIINTLNLGAAGLDEAAQEAQAFGAAVSSEAAAAAAEFNDNLDRMRSLVTQAGQSILTGILPQLNELIGRFVECIRQSGMSLEALKQFSSLASGDLVGDPGEKIQPLIDRIGQLRKQVEEWRRLQESADDAGVGEALFGTSIDAANREIDTLLTRIRTLEAAAARMRAAGAGSVEPSKKTEAPALAKASTKDEAAKSRLSGWDAEYKKAATIHELKNRLVRQDAEFYKQFWTQKLAQCESGSAEEAAITLRLQQNELQAWRQSATEKTAMDNAELQRKMQKAESQASLLRTMADAEVAAGRMSSEERLQLEQETEERLYEIKREALERRRELALEDPTMSVVARQQLLEQIEELEIQHAERMTQLQTQAAEMQKQKYSGLFQSMSSGFQSVLTQFMKGQLTIKGLFQGMLEAVMSAIIGAIAKMVAEWITAKISMMVMGKAAATSSVMQAAAEAGAKGTASWAGAPWPINMGAPAFGASMFAAAAAYEGVAASAAGGFDIPAGVNPLTQLHEQEMVLPKDIANPLRSALAEDGGGRTQVVLQGVDAGKFFMCARADLVKALRSANRDFAFGV